MAVHHATQGFIFKQENWSDADRVFSVFTKDFGRLEIFSKAARKIASKLRGGVQVFSFCDIEFIEGRNRKILTDAVCVKKFIDVLMSPEKYEVACAIGALADQFIAGQEKEEAIFNELGHIFAALDEYKIQGAAKGGGYGMTYWYFFWNFMAILGYEPELSKCVSCPKQLNPHQLYFSYSEGGIVCGTCVRHHKNAIVITADFVKVVRLMLKKDWQTVSRVIMGKHALALLQQLSQGYYTYVLSAYNRPHDVTPHE